MDDQGLNRFVSSVSNRYNHDTIITGGSMALLLLVPVACTFIAGSLLNNNSELKTDTGQCTTTIMVIESLMIMFIMLSMYNRLSEHSARDHEWRAGLISYAENRGCDVSKLARMDLMGALGEGPDEDPCVGGHGIRRRPDTAIHADHVQRAG